MNDFKRRKRNEMRCHFGWGSWHVTTLTVTTSKLFHELFKSEIYLIETNLIEVWRRAGDQKGHVVQTLASEQLAVSIQYESGQHGEKIGINTTIGHRFKI